MTREAMSSSSRTWARRCLLALALAIAATCAGDVVLRAQNDGTPANALQIRDRLAVAADRIGVRPLGSDDPLLFHSRLVEIDGKLTVGFRDIGLAARGWPIELVRHWHDGAPDTGLGPGWGWSFGVRAERDPDTNDWLVREADGSSTHYRDEAGGRHRAIAGRIGTSLQEVQGGIHRTWSDGAVERFDAKGQLTARLGSDGSGYQLQRSTDGLGMAVLDSSGLRLTLRFTGGRLVEAADTLGRSWRYEYAEGRLQAVADALGRRTTFATGSGGQLASIVSPDQTRLSIERDVEGRVSRLVGPGALQTTFAHRGSAGEQRFVQTRTDATGRATRLEMRRDDADPNVAFLQVVFPGGEERVHRFAPGTIDSAANGRWTAGADLDAAGNLIAAFDGRGLRVDLTARAPRPGTGAHPDERGLPRLLASEDGSPAWAEYDAAGRRIARYGHAGGIERYTWDAGDRLTGWIDAAGGENRLDWDDGDRMLRWVEPGGRVTRWLYDDRGQVVAIERQGVGTLTRQYDPAGRLQAFDADDRLWRVNYDTAGRPLTLDSEGGKITLRWSDQGLLSGIVDEVGRDIDLSDGAIWSLADTLGRRRTLAATADGEVVATEPTGATTVVAALPGGDRRVETHTPDGSALIERVDTAGNLIDATVVGPAPVTIETDGNGRIQRWGDPAAPVTLAYDDAGRLTERVGPTGLVTRFEHDAKGQLTAVSSPLGAARIAYDEAGRPNRLERDDGLVAERVYDREGRIVSTRETDALGTVTEHRTTWDGEGRPVTVERSDGTRTSASYDRAGNLVEIVEQSGPQTLRTTYARDKLGRVVSTTDPDGAVTSIEYDSSGRPVAIKSSEQTLAFNWGSDNLLAGATVNGVAVETRRGPLGGAVVEERAQDPDADGAVRIVLAQDRRGGTWTLAFNTGGHLIRATDPLGGTIRIGRDITGRNTAIEDAGGRRRFIHYDTLDRPVSTGVAGGWAIGTAYDGQEPVGLSWSGGTVLTIDKDRASRTLVGRIGSEVVARRRFDERGRLLEVEGQAGTIRYEYDAASRVTAEIDVYGRRIEYRYDTIGRLTQLVLPEGDIISYVYGPAGRLESQTGPDGVAQKMEAGPTRHDMALTLGGISVTLTSGADQMLDAVAVTAGRDKRELTIERDRSDSVIATRRGSNVDSYVSDALGRVVQAVHDGRTYHYAYDASGNVVSSQTGEQRSYDSAYRLTAVAGGAPTYDGDGRMLTDAHGRRFTWDRVGRLIQIDGAGSQVTLRYDPLGRLSERVENGKVERYLHAADGVAAVYDSEGRRTALLERNALAPHIVRLHRADGAVLLLPDQRGTPAFSVSANGIETLPRHDPWGGAPAQPPDFFRWIGFGGELEEPLAGLVLYAHRPYAPALQRFLAPDPAGLLGGLNPYAFAANDPVGAREIGGLAATRIGIGPNARLPHTMPDWGTPLQTNLERRARQFTGVLESVVHGTPGPAADAAFDTLEILNKGGVTLDFYRTPPSDDIWARTKGKNIEIFTSKIDALEKQLVGRGVPRGQIDRAVAGILVHEIVHVGQNSLTKKGDMDRGFRELEANLHQTQVDRLGHAFKGGGAKTHAQAIGLAADHALGAQMQWRAEKSQFAPLKRGFEGLYELTPTRVFDLARRLTPDLPPSVLMGAVADAYQKGLDTWGDEIFGAKSHGRQSFQKYINVLRRGENLLLNREAAGAFQRPPASLHPPNGSKMTVANAVTGRPVAHPQAVKVAPPPPSAAPATTRARPQSPIKQPAKAPPATAASTKSPAAARAPLHPTTRPPGHATQRLPAVAPQSGPARTARPNVPHGPSASAAPSAPRNPAPPIANGPRPRPPLAPPRVASHGDVGDAFAAPADTRVPRTPVRPRPPAPDVATPRPVPPDVPVRRPPGPDVATPRPPAPDVPARVPAAFEGPRPSQVQPADPARAPVPVERARPPSLTGADAPHRPPRVLPPDMPPAPVRPHGSFHLPPLGAVAGVVLNNAFAALDIYSTMMDLDAYWSGRMGHGEFWSRQGLTVASYMLPFPANAAVAAHMLGGALGEMAAHALLQAAREGDPFARAFLDWMQRSGHIGANDPTFVSIGQRPPPQLAAAALTIESSASADVPPTLTPVSVAIDTRLIATRQSWARVDRADMLLSGTMPTGATSAGPWRWRHDSPDTAGVATHESSGSGVDIHTIIFDAARFAVTGERLVQYLWIDPDAPPQQIALQVYDERMSAAHRLSFGEDIVVFDEATGTGLVAGGRMPPRGRWLRLAIPTKLIGIDGRRIKGLGFVTAGGRVLWGRTTTSSADDLSPLVTTAEAHDTGGQSDVEILVAIEVERAGRLQAVIEREGGGEISLLDADVAPGRRVVWWQGAATAVLGGTVRVRQPDDPARSATVALGTAPGLVARIAYPPSGAIVRQTVPIFGEAGGPGFERYEVDVRRAGGGEADWRQVARSRLPSAIVLSEVHTRLADIMARNLRATVHGNLASIETGSRLHRFAFAPQTEAVPSGGIEVRLRAFGRDGTIVEDRIDLIVGEVAASPAKALIDSPDGQASLTVPPFALARGLGALSVEPVSITAPEGAPAPLSLAYQAGPGGLMLSAGAELAIQASREAQTIIALDADGSWRALPTQRKGLRLTTAINRIGESVAFYAAAIQSPPRPDVAASVTAPWPTEAPAPGLLFASRAGADGKLYAGPPIALSDNPVLVLDHSAHDVSSLGLVLRSGTEARLVPLGASRPLGGTSTIAPPLAMTADGTRRAIWLPLAQLAPPGVTAVDAIDLVHTQSLAWNTLGVRPAAAVSAGLHSIAIGRHPPPGSMRRFSAASVPVDVPSSEGWHWVAIGGAEWPVLVDTMPPAISDARPEAGAESASLSVSAVLRDAASGVHPSTISVTANGLPLPANTVNYDPASGRMQASIAPVAAALRLEDGAAVEVAISVSDRVGNRSPDPLRWTWTWRAQPVVAGPLRQLTTSGAEDASFTADGGLVFVATRDGRTDLFKSDSIGGAVERLTNDDAVESSPAPHPQGRGIAFVRDGAIIWLRDGVEMIVTQGATDPAWWGPDHLVAGRADAVVALTIGGSETTLCRAATGSTVRRPRPSPDGIVFTQAIYHESAWTCDPVTSNVRPLSRNLDDPELREIDGTPGGANAALLLTAGGRGGLWRAPLDGGERMPVLAAGTGVDRRPTLAPDRSAIVFDSDRTGRRELWRLDLPAAPRFSVRPSNTGPAASEAVLVSLATDTAANAASLSVLGAADRAILAEIAPPAALAAGNHQWRLLTAGLPSGEHIVELKLDALSVRAPIRIDRDGPTLSIVRGSDRQPLAPGLKLADDEHIAVSAQDASGVRSIEYASADGAWSAYQRPLSVAVLESPRLKLRATDSFGNVAEREVSIELAQPRVRPLPAQPPHGWPLGTIMIVLTGLLLLAAGAFGAVRMRR
jgi:RHS repeat-associated protein